MLSPRRLLAVQLPWSHFLFSQKIAKAGQGFCRRGQVSNVGGREYLFFRGHIWPWRKTRSLQRICMWMWRTEKMSKISKQPIHLQRELSDYTHCGIGINGYSVRHTHSLQDVTCERCLSALKYYCQCPKCDALFSNRKDWKNETHTTNNMVYVFVHLLSWYGQGRGGNETQWQLTAKYRQRMAAAPLSATTTATALMAQGSGLLVFRRTSWK